MLDGALILLHGLPRFVAMRQDSPQNAPGAKGQRSDLLFPSDVQRPLRQPLRSLPLLLTQRDVGLQQPCPGQLRRAIVFYEDLFGVRQQRRALFWVIQMQQQGGQLQVCAGDEGRVCIGQDVLAGLGQRFLGVVIASQARVGHGLIQQRLPDLFVHAPLGEEGAHVARDAQHIAKASQGQQAIAQEHIQQEGVAMAAIVQKDVPGLVHEGEGVGVAAQHQIGDGHALAGAGGLHQLSRGLHAPQGVLRRDQ